jgi:hypothetical protein
MFTFNKDKVCSICNGTGKDQKGDFCQCPIGQFQFQMTFGKVAR